MSRQAYKVIKFEAATIELIQLMEEICDDYESQNLVLTARQLYYRLVATDVIPNTLQSYKRITGVINDAKLAGLLDWEMFEDRTRSFKSYRTYDSPAEIIDEMKGSYFMDLWEGQEERVFCVVEKEALYGVLERSCLSNGVPLLAARGYPSSTVLHDFVENNLQHCERYVRILHFGDHDPSGIDMTRDLRDRLMMFAEEYDVTIEVDRLALNYDQIEELKPPPNPAKLTDSRVGGYISKFGKSSWELDAVEPKRLISIVKDAIFANVDMAVWDKRVKEMNKGRKALSNFAATFKR